MRQCMLSMAVYVDEAVNINVAVHVDEAVHVGDGSAY